MLSLTQRLCGVLPAGVSIVNDQDHRSSHLLRDFPQTLHEGRVARLHSQFAPPILDDHQTSHEEGAPINRLPLELFGEIFQHYLAELRKDSFTVRVSSLRSTTFAQFNPVILGHVCSSWRALTLAMPTLWSSIAVIKPTMSHIPMIQLWLERAADCPLSLTIFQSYGEDPGVAQRAATHNILLLFLARARQWRRIEFHFHDKSTYIPFLNVSPSVLGMLEDIDVDMGFWDRAVADCVWQKFHSLPSLRRVSWDSSYFYNGIPTHVPWAQLTHFKMHRVLGLSLPGLLDILRQCEALRVLDCDIDVPWGKDVSFLATPVVLPYLHDLKISVDGSGDPGPLISHISLPSLASFDILHDFSRDTRNRLAPYLHDLLVRSACSLEVLSLHDRVLTEDELVMVLELPQVQTLRQLDLVCCEMTDQTSVLLAQKEAGQMRVLPRLEALCLPTCRFSSDMVSALVTARSPQLRSIRMACKCLIGRPTHDLDYLQSLQSAGHDFRFGIFDWNE
ncbi:hypothetical protein Hypma_008595 [Hypsizygus marmoreus]|uniref:F-box domain-containing protein n=1 Tax=Hypsizygus marmoreus TaxID=39966 RepID=A0A369JSM5_HYPMA|nr:hypothetical protein Hypma_008595 [Hypsizygus marmoreus]